MLKIGATTLTSFALAGDVKPNQFYAEGLGHLDTSFSAPLLPGSPDLANNSAQPGLPGLPGLPRLPKLL